MMSRFSTFIVLLICFVCAQAQIPNPYCIGGGNLTQLGLPEGCEWYGWGWNLNNERLFPMVRPYRYYDYVGANSDTKYWCYNHTKQEIGRSDADRDLLKNYVQSHPGRIWLIGNEPEVVSQDGLSVSDYVVMFRTYYNFIKQYDSTALFANAASYTMVGSTYLNTMLFRYQDMLNQYKNKYGSEMPVDVWNIHVYARASHAGQTDEFIKRVDQFDGWVDTVRAGIYKKCDIIITEFGIIDPSGISQANLIKFMNTICPQLEGRVGPEKLSRFFWFYGGWAGSWSAAYAGCSLLDAEGNPTPLGSAYVVLAKNWEENHKQQVPPIAKITVDTDSGSVPLIVQFDGTSSTDEDGQLIAYQWDFGDGIKAVGEQITHTYQDTGLFKAILTVIDNDSNSHSDSVFIAVGDSAQPSGLLIHESRFHNGNLQVKSLGNEIKWIVPGNRVEAFEVHIFDIKGKTVQILRNSLGENQILWNGKDGFGRDISQGLYYVRVSVKSQTVWKRLTVVR